MIRYTTVAPTRSTLRRGGRLLLAMALTGAGLFGCAAKSDEIAGAHEVSARYDYAKIIACHGDGGEGDAIATIRCNEIELPEDCDRGLRDGPDGMPRRDVGDCLENGAG